MLVDKATDIVTVLLQAAMQTLMYAVQGSPVNIKDFKLLLDQRVYERLEGKWHDLLNRVKWDTVRSVVKSVTGLQRGKFKVSPCSSQSHVLMTYSVYDVHLSGTSAKP